MTQYEWLTCDDPKKMNAMTLAYVNMGRLPLVAEVRLRSRIALIALHAMEYVGRGHDRRMPYHILEDWIDGGMIGMPPVSSTALYDYKVLDLLRKPYRELLSHCEAFVTYDHNRRYYCQLVRSILGDPFVSVVVGDVPFVSKGRQVSLIPSSCVDGETTGLVDQIYYDRWYEGMPILIDMLVDKGLPESVDCPACRGRGEWVEDLSSTSSMGVRMVECGVCRTSKRITHPAVTHVRTPHCPVCYKIEFENNPDSDLSKLYHECHPYPHVRGDWLLDLFRSHGVSSKGSFTTLIERIDG